MRAQGAWRIDVSGRAYLDAYDNVPHVGHCHPAVVQAFARQAATLNTNTRYLYESVLDYAERLADRASGRVTRSGGCRRSRFRILRARRCESGAGASCRNNRRRPVRARSARRPR